MIWYESVPIKILWGTWCLCWWSASHSLKTLHDAIFQGSCWMERGNRRWWNWQGKCVGRRCLSHWDLWCSVCFHRSSQIQCTTQSSAYVTSLIVDFPSLILYIDKEASKAWIIKSAKKSPQRRALGCLQWKFMINDSVGINSDWVSRNDNVISNCISQFLNHADPSPQFLTLVQEFPQLQHCKCFNQSVELASFMDALLQVKAPNPRGKIWKTKYVWQKHLLPFCHEYHLGDPCLQIPFTCANKYFLACYAISLNKGYNSWLHHQIQHNHKLYHCQLPSLHQQGVTLALLFQGQIYVNHHPHLTISQINSTLAQHDQ